MPNWVGNVFSVYGLAGKPGQLEQAVRELIGRLKVEDTKSALWGKQSAPKEFDRRTKRTDIYGRDLAFESAWGVCHVVQDKICEILYLVDPGVIIQNDYQEEAYNFVGTRLVTYSDDGLECYNNEKDLSEDLEEIDEKITALEDQETVKGRGEEAEAANDPTSATIEELEEQRAKLINKVRNELKDESWKELYDDLPSRRVRVPIIL